MRKVDEIHVDAIEASIRSFEIIEHCFVVDVRAGTQSKRTKRYTLNCGLVAGIFQVVNATQNPSGEVQPVNTA